MPINDIDLKRDNKDADRTNANIRSMGNTLVKSRMSGATAWPQMGPGGVECARCIVDASGRHSARATASSAAMRAAISP